MFAATMLKEMKRVSGAKTQKDLCTVLGVSEPYISKMKKSDRIPEDILSAFDEEYGTSFEESMAAYLTKKKNGEVVSDWTKKSPQEILELLGAEEPAPRVKMAVLNYYPNTHTAAGYGAVNGEETPEKLMVPAEFLRSMFKLDSLVGLDVIHVTGDSMEPIVKHGDAIIVQKTAEARNNQIVIARIHDEYYVKRLVKDPINKKVRLTSENDYYPDMDISGGQLAELEIVGVVVGKYKPF